MRLDNYLIESDTYIRVDNANELIHRDCKTYLNLIRGKAPLFRGLHTASHDIGIKDVRKDRESKGMGYELAKMFNKFLKDNGHSVRSQSVICTSDYNHSQKFGHPYYIFPLDPIKKYTWVEARDINIDFRSTGWSDDTVEAWAAKKDGRANDHDKFILKKLMAPFERNFHTNTGFNEAYSKRFEIWFECDKYYYMDTEYLEWDDKRQSVIVL